jgi:outer membrane lipoprotein SlyB
MRKFWLCVLVVLALSGCATQEASSPKQAKAEGDFYDCARTEGVRGASITNIVDTPSGVSFKFKIDGGGEVSIAQTKILATCMRAKGYRIDGYR